MDKIPHFETMVETILCWHLQGNHHSGFLGWGRISSTHTMRSPRPLTRPRESARRLVAGGQDDDLGDRRHRHGEVQEVQRREEEPACGATKPRPGVRSRQDPDKKRATQPKLL